jgi:hypothetical protein
VLVLVVEKRSFSLPLFTWAGPGSSPRKAVSWQGCLTSGRQTVRSTFDRQNHPLLLHPATPCVLLATQTSQTTRTTPNSLGPCFSLFRHLTAIMASAANDQELLPEQTEGFKVGEKKTMDEYSKMGMHTFQHPFHRIVL